MESISKPFTITYSNYFKVGEKTFAFKKKHLFDITNTPKFLEQKSNNGSNGYWINRVWYSLTKINSMLVKEPVTVDISSLQWFEQVDLETCNKYSNA